MCSCSSIRCWPQQNRRCRRLKRVKPTWLALGVAAILFAGMSTALGEVFSSAVDASGNISLPEDYRTSWTFLGAWSIDGDTEDGGAKDMHIVYTEAKTVAAYRDTGTWPDGAVLVKEVIKTKSDDMTTGRVSWAEDIAVIFVMVKDKKGRFKGNPLWGNGWGWALFKAPDLAKQVAENFESDCLGCHVPAKNDDWIYIRGYPLLRKSGQ